MAFTEGVRTGWIASDLISWIDEHLVASRRLDIRGEHAQTVREHGAGIVSLSGAARVSTRDRVRTSSQVPVIIAAARMRVIDELRVTVRTGETHFVNAALYAGRVARERAADGKPQWFVYVSEDDALSDQVLALFAADALTNPSHYEHDIAVCDACGRVTFQSSPASRRGCDSHPYGSLDGSKSEREPTQRIIART